MTVLDFSVDDVEVEPYAVTPNLTVRLRMSESTGATVRAVALRAQVRIEPHRRPYSDAEGEGLRDLFGPRERWSSTLRTFLWMECSTVVQGFTGTTVAALPMACTYDFSVTASKYLHALGDGTIPIVVLLSGTVFTDGQRGFSVQQIPWDRSAAYELSVDVWKQLMATHYPASGWVRLDHETIADLVRFKAAHGLTDLDSAVRQLLTASQVQR
ncbi:DUF6084 family protein [Rhodococcus sp. NPDC059969]|uniref:DUF6084 family protein n=1 Tax=Rhodococcus sp. NPDC059969 TaxID=3347018 RepID=UPI00366C994D